MARFKFYQQLEHSDCGITCIRMIARYYGQKIPLKTLRDLTEQNRLGISIRDMTDCFRALGMMAATVKIGMDDFYRMPTPAILFWKNSHFVIVYKIDSKRKKIYIADPAGGKMVFSEEEFKRAWLDKAESGIAILAAPEADDFETRSYESAKSPGLLNYLLNQLKAHRNRFIVILLLSIILFASDLAVPLLFQQTIDTGLQQKDVGLVWLLVLSQLAIFAGSFLTSSVVRILMVKLGLKVNIEMMGQYFRHLIRQPLSFFDRKVSSDLIQKTDDQSNIKEFLISLPQTVFFICLNFVILSGLMIYFSREVFLFFLLLSVIQTGWSLLFIPKKKAINYSYFTYMSDNRNIIYEMVNGMVEIKTNNAQHQKVAAWHDTQSKINRLSLRSAMVDLVSGGGSSLLGHLRDLAVTGLCATLVIYDRMSLGTLMAVGYVAGNLSSYFSQFIELVNTTQNAKVSYERLDEILNSEEDNSEKTRFSTQSIEFRDVSFKYPGKSSPTVINNISLTVPEGKITALVGESGCGKTTLIKLMLGFYQVTEGELIAGGVDMRQLDIDDWLAHCGVVSQTGYIFSDSILANIAVADREPDEERVRLAMKIAEIESFVDSLPMGLSTRIGTTGIDLSGGQRQRILIARAIYKNPALLFLDEATSSLDANNERRIVENFRNFYKGRTVVIAAHRLSTVKDADNIVYIREGEIIEQGSHSELIAKKGEYFCLVRNQLDRLPE